MNEYSYNRRQHPIVVDTGVRQSSASIATTYDRTAAKKKDSEKKKNSEGESSRTDGTKKHEVEKAMDAVRFAIDCVLDCAPNSRDFHEVDDVYDSKSYTKAVKEHNERVDALHEILSGLQDLMKDAK